MRMRCSNCGYRFRQDFPRGYKDTVYHECQRCGCETARAEGHVDDTLGALEGTPRADMARDTLAPTKGPA